MRRMRANNVGRSGSCEIKPKNALRSLDDIVQAYIADYRDKANQEHHWYGQGSFEQVIKKAALSKLPTGKRHDHQRRIPERVLKQVSKALKSSVRLAFATTFDQLHREVERTIGGIHGIGDLTVYDVADRIAAHLRLEPELVYLHAGTQVGARALGLTGNVLSKSALPRSFQKLAPGEIENCLCIYTNQIRALRHSQRQMRPG